MPEAKAQGQAREVVHEQDIQRTGGGMQPGMAQHAQEGTGGEDMNLHLRKPILERRKRKSCEEKQQLREALDKQKDGEQTFIGRFVA